MTRRMSRKSVHIFKHVQVQTRARGAVLPAHRSAHLGTRAHRHVFLVDSVKVAKISRRFPLQTVSYFCRASVSPTGEHAPTHT